ncbi:unnamed protein product [Diatraea saccharalis]|uniref:Uncharacterized protein n=1 Tax=Diatraea saccharalis TaxID=40085 RepID=A0A9N9R084_9NEOP|nr:unnamed protein product [Diatraea saccharalis]
MAQQHNNSRNAMSINYHFSPISMERRYRALEPSGSNGCYQYTLLITNTAMSDARVYVLHVENERGFSSHAVSLTVHESVEYKTDDLDSEKTVLPADAVYTSREQQTARPPQPNPAAAARSAGVTSQYSPGALQAALNSLEREAKENVYAVLDPHIQYEVTINKHGEPPKYLSLSRPLNHQRTHHFNPQVITNNEINNNDYFNENRFSTFKTGPPKARRSNKSNDRKIRTYESYVCKTNNDVEYSKNPFFGIARDAENNIEPSYR